MKKLAIVILNYNTRKLTADCIRSIEKSNPKLNYDLYLVDNNSTDDSVDYISKSFSSVKIVKNKANYGFGKGYNRLLRKIYRSYEVVMLLNSDTLIKNGYIDKIYAVFTDFGFDILSLRLIDANGRFQPNAGRLPTFFNLFFWLSGLDDILRPIIKLPSYQERNPNYYRDKKEVGWVSGTVMLINPRVFEEIGFFDEKIFMYVEDVDFCQRAKRAGFRIGWTNTVSLIHLGGGSSKDAKFTQWTGEFKNLIYLYKKNYGDLASIALKVLIALFVLVRVFVFLILGRVTYAKSYAKIITKL